MIKTMENTQNTAENLSKLWHYNKKLFYQFMEKAIWTPEALENFSTPLANVGFAGYRLPAVELAMSNMAPNDIEEISPKILRMVGAIPLPLIRKHHKKSESGAFFRLVFFPVIVSSTPIAPASRRPLEKALRLWEVDKTSSEFIFSGNFLNPIALSRASFHDMQSILRHICRWRNAPQKFSLYKKDIEAAENIAQPHIAAPYRGSFTMPAVLAAALIVPSLDDDIPLIDGVDSLLDEEGVAAMLGEILYSDQRIIDIAPPVSTNRLFGDGFLNFLNMKFLVTKMGVPEEIKRFIEICKKHTKNGVLHANIVGHMNSVDIQLMNNRQEFLDSLSINFEERPVSLYELVDILGKHTNACQILLHQESEPSIFNNRQIHHGQTFPRKQALRVIIGGKLQKTIDDLNNWGSGLRKNLEAQLSSGKTSTE